MQTMQVTIQLTIFTDNHRQARRACSEGYPPRTNILIDRETSMFILRKGRCRMSSNNPLLESPLMINSTTSTLGSVLTSLPTQKAKNHNQVIILLSLLIRRSTPSTTPKDIHVPTGIPLANTQSRINLFKFPIRTIGRHTQRAILRLSTTTYLIQFSVLDK
jgi:hypothetical protein